MKPPNIFKFATKELSQDAFFCWLLNFASPEFENSNYADLHNLGKDFFKHILNYDTEINHLEIKTQVKSIDIWIEVNNTDLIIIEDKTYSNLGENQLKRYYDYANTLIINNAFKSLHCVYFKFGLEAEREFTRNEYHDKWTKKSLNDLIRVFNKYQNIIQHPFFLDYYEMASKSYEIINDFSNFIIKDNFKIENRVLEAFYKNLEIDQVFFNWKYIDQRGARNYFATDYEYKGQLPSIYIQLDKLELRLKIDLGLLKDERGPKYKKFQKNLKENNIRFIYDSVRDLCEKKLPFKINKPARMAVHNFLTVATFDSSQWLIYSQKNTLDYQATKIKLLEINSIVKQKNNELHSEIKNIVNQALIN